jgi:hypothetical protein
MDFRDDSDKFIGILINERMRNFDFWDLMSVVVRVSDDFQVRWSTVELVVKWLIICNGFV